MHQQISCGALSSSGMLTSVCASVQSRVSCVWEPCNWPAHCGLVARAMPHPQHACCPCSPLPIPDPKADVDQTQPLPLGGVLGCAAEGGMLDDGVIGLLTGGGVGQWAGTLGRVAEDSESEVDLTLSSESSDHPLHDPSLLDKLVYAHPLVRGMHTCSLSG